MVILKRFGRDELSQIGPERKFAKCQKADKINSV